MKNLIFEIPYWTESFPVSFHLPQKRFFQKFFVDTSFHTLKFDKISFGNYHKFIQII